MVLLGEMRKTRHCERFVPAIQTIIKLFLPSSRQLKYLTFPTQTLNAFQFCFLHF